MLQISNKKLNDIKEGFKNKKIIIVGDMMLDGYYWGDVNRISPEAPVPVIEIDDEFFRFGGAANVAFNIQKLGGTPLPIGVIGDDNEGRIFKSLLDEAGLSQNGMIEDTQRPTTAKTRVIARNQHIVRIDKESKNNVDEKIENKILTLFEKFIDDADGVILQDYNKGVLTPNLIEQIIKTANKQNKIITVDPKFDNFLSYSNVTVFKPNKKETEDAFGIRIYNEDDLNKAGEKLLKKLNAKFVLLTLGEDGIALFEQSKPAKRIQTKARKVADVSGAGDTVISTLTMALAAGADIYQAAYMANYAGGLVCEEMGIVPVELDNLFSEIEKNIFE